MGTAGADFRQGRRRKINRPRLGCGGIIFNKDQGDSEKEEEVQGRTCTPLRCRSAGAAADTSKINSSKRELTDLCHVVRSRRHFEQFDIVRKNERVRGHVDQMLTVSMTR